MKTLASEFVELGFLASEFLGSGFWASEFVEWGFLASEFLGLGFWASEFEEWGFSRPKKVLDLDLLVSRRS